MPRDVGTWLAVAALILAIPLSIIGNLLTPFLKNWWAESSATRTRERIAELESMLAEMAGYAPMTEVEDEILSAIPKLDLFITMTLMLVLSAMALLFAQQTPESAWRSISIMFGAIIVISFVRMGLFSGTERFIRRRSPKWRRMLEQDIAKLKSKLANRSSGDTTFQKNSFQ